MKIINTLFILHPKKNKQAAGHTQSKPQHINSGVDFVAPDVSPGDQEIILYHRSKISDC
jgi:hypothetical protein